MQPTPRSMSFRVVYPPKPTNSSELGREPLSSGPNEGLPPRLSVLLAPRSMATEGQPQKASSRGSGPVTAALRRVWRFRWPPDRPLQDHPGDRGLCPSGMLTCTLWQRDLAEPDLAAASAYCSGAFSSLRLPIYGTSEPGPWLLPGSRCQLWPGHMKTSPKIPMLGGSLASLPRHCPANCSSDKVTSRAWPKKTKLSLSLWGLNGF
jgi:hypothetical protein